MGFGSRYESIRRDIDRRMPSFSFSLLVFFFVAFGCASSAYRTHPQFERRAKSIEKPGLVFPDIKIYEFSSGGVMDLREDWCKTAKENVQRAILKGFEDKKYRVRPLSIHGDMEKEMGEIQALYKAVNKSIQLHTYGPQLLPFKEKSFDYSVGPIEKVLQSLDIDSMIFVSGFDEFTASGRNAALSVSLVDRSGTVVWYALKGSKGGYDLREPEGAQGLVKDILSYLPEANR